MAKLIRWLIASVVLTQVERSGHIVENTSVFFVFFVFFVAPLF